MNRADLEVEASRVALEVPELDEAAARSLIEALSEPAMRECQGMPDGPLERPASS